MPGRADLHCHTTASDGTFAPRALVEEALARCLAAIAVTDHDSVEGIDEAAAAGAELGVVIVAGVEISTDVEGGEVHVLGYCVDVRRPGFLDMLARQRESRMSRVHTMLAKLDRLGVHVEISDVLASAEEGAAIGRPHVAAAMIRAGHVSSWDEAFTRYIGRQAPAYVPRSKVTPHEAVAEIAAAGGVPVLAHPGLSNQDHMIPSLVDAGLMGIEAVYPDHTADQQRRYHDIARQYGLITTGGSDCHGPGSRSGVVLGTSTVGAEIVDELDRLAARNR